MYLGMLIAVPQVYTNAWSITCSIFRHIFFTICIAKTFIQKRHTRTLLSQTLVSSRILELSYLDLGNLTSMTTDVATRAKSSS